MWSKCHLAEVVARVQAGVELDVGGILDCNWCGYDDEPLGGEEEWVVEVLGGGLSGHGWWEMGWMVRWCNPIRCRFGSVRCVENGLSAPSQLGTLHLAET